MRYTIIAVSLALSTLISFSTSSSAIAQETVMTERTLTNPTGWWQYHNVTPEQVSQFLSQNNARLVDLDVNSASPLRLSAAMVANTGPHASGWYWYYGQTASR